MQDADSLTFLTPYGYQSGSCGYCKDPLSSQRTPDSRGSYYATSTDISVNDYQELLDRGWRRSGTLLYKPDLQRSCCPHYTIRLPVTSLQTTKNHRQTLHRWNNYVLGQHYISQAARVHPKTKEEKKRSRNEFELLATIHEAEHYKVKKPLEPEHRFEVSLDDNDVTDEKYRLFEHYQQVVHKESPSQVSKSGFQRFLCDSPLQRTARIVNGKVQNLGSFHQCYRLDGRLIAMGVLDLLPHAVSGVYFIYHQDFEKWSFGKLSALREAALAIEAGYDYYYMGFYIHSCAKMRYKADFKPQYILDPETYAWDEFDDEFKRKLDAQKYVSLSRGRRCGATPTTTAADATQNSNCGSEEDGIIFPSPAAAASSGLSLFDLQMPGVMTLEEVKANIDLDQNLVVLRRGQRRVAKMQDLVGWESGSFSDPRSLKCTISELAACVGPRIASHMIIDFR